MTNNCPKCNHIIDTNENYDCPNCGEKFWQSKEKFDKHINKMKLEKENTISKSDLQAYCSNCGKDIAENDKFCGGCGEVIEDENKDDKKLSRNVGRETISGRNGYCVLIVIVVAILFIWGLSTSGSNTKVEDIKVTLADTTVDSLVSTCVEHHKSLFKPKIQELLDGTGFIPQSETKKGAYTSDECKQIIIWLDNNGYSYTDITRMAENNIWTGMSTKLLVMSVGLPNDINSTTTVFGKSSQWIYGNPLYGAVYVYLDNGKVTAWQN